MSVELIYKTTSAFAESWWKNMQEKRAEQAELRRAFEDEMLATYGPADVRYGEGVGKRLLMTNGRVVTGLHSGYAEVPPSGSGWRLDSKARFWKPALREAAGKEVKERLQGLTLYVWQSHVKEIGVPEYAFGDSHVYSPGLDCDNEPFALYVLWGSGTCAKDFDQVRASVPQVAWNEVPRSEWYARVEAKEKVA